MFIDYTEAFNAVTLVAQATLSHAGDVEVFEDEEGWLCIRTKLMKTTNKKWPDGVVHEPITNDGLTPRQLREKPTYKYGDIITFALSDGRVRKAKVHSVCRMVGADGWYIEAMSEGEHLMLSPHEIVDPELVDPGR